MNNIFTYNVLGNGAVITDAKRTPAKMWKIPSHIDGNLVVGIQSFAFALRDDVEVVHIPDTVHVIGAEAFRHCKNLKYVAFYQTQETSVTPLDIGSLAFHNCASLESVDISIPTYVRDFAFWKCPNMWNFNVKILGAEKMAFAGCEKLRTVSFGRNASWEANSFKGCKALSHLFFYHPIARHMVTYPTKMKLLKGKTISCSSDFNCLDLAYAGYNLDVSL